MMANQIVLVELDMDFTNKGHSLGRIIAVVVDNHLPGGLQIGQTILTVVSC